MGPMRKSAIFVVATVVAALAAFSPPKAAFAAVTDETFSYTGSVQYFLVPGDVSSVDIAAYGASGGGGFQGGGGGLGAEAHSTSLTVTPGERLQIVVGGAGAANGGTSAVAGGFNGGGGGGSG